MAVALSGQVLATRASPKGSLHPSERGLQESEGPEMWRPHLLVSGISKVTTHPFCQILAIRWK